MSRGNTSTRRANNLRRQRVGVRSLEPFGIERGDRAILEINTDDIQIGEVGYFKMPRYDDEDTYKQFKIVGAQNSACRNHWKAREADFIEQGGLCLRTVREVCEGQHEGRLIGRVVAVERDGLSVQTALPMRPPHTYDAPPPCETRPTPSAERRGLGREVAQAINESGGQPKSQPKRAKVQSIKTRQNSQKYINITQPFGWREGDKMSAMLVESDGYESMGILEGDTIITYQTADVQAGDVATVRTLRKGYFTSGYYRPRPGGYVEIESPDKTRTFKPGSFEVIGRVVGVVRADEYVLTGYTFRGIYHADQKSGERFAREIARFKGKLDRLDFEPYNEACRFQLEKQIDDLEREATFDEWPDTVNA